MRRMLLGFALLAGCSALAPTMALARPHYFGAFEKLYMIKPTSNLKRAGCNICHMGADKKVRNPYGMELAKALGKAPANPDEATAAMKKIETMVSADKKTKFIDLIKADKLPGGP